MLFVYMQDVLKMPTYISQTLAKVLMFPLAKLGVN